MQKLKNILLTFVGTSIILAPAAATSAVFADGTAGTLNGPNGSICSGVNDTGSSPTVNGTPGTGTTGCDQGTTSNDTIENTLKAVVNILSVIVGVVAVIMIIIAGFRYITSGGESSNVSGAKNAIIYAIVGLVIVALAQILVRFVINRALGATTSS